MGKMPPGDKADKDYERIEQLMNPKVKILFNFDPKIFYEQDF